MANEIQLPVKLYIENLQSIVKDMRGQLGNLKVDSAGYKRLLNVINDIEKRIQSVQVQSSRPFFDMKQFNDVEKEIGRIQDDFTKIGIEAGKVKFSDLQLDASQRAKLQEFDAAIKASNEELKNLKETAKEAFLSSDVGQLWKENHKDAAARSFEQITKVIVNEVQQQKDALKEAENAYNDYKNLISTNRKLGAFLGKNQNHELSEANMGKEMYDRIFGTRGDKTVFKSGGRDLLTDWLVKNFSLDRSVVEKLVADSADKVQKAFAEVHGKVEQALQQEKIRIGSAAKEARTSSNNGKSYTEAITEKQATLNAAEAANNGLVATNQAVKRTEEELIDSIERNKAAREEYKQEILRQAQAYLEMRGPAEQASGSLQKLTQVAEQGKARLASLDKATGKLQGISNFINRYVGAYAIIRKVTQAIRNAFSNIKELDKVITNIAVVTNMSQQDLWGKIGEYTDMAQQYGVATKDVYTVSQLFYQQGLQTNQVMSLTTETLKMAKIAGMDYAEATNAMTVAIRAFNIDMQQAQQVTDTYSALAAKFAVSSAEIANAMEKTASSAANVGMSLQSTSAFMSVMIQTTRESAQNIGSALKSIISRYGEMKASPASLINVDGEEVAFNKVDTALKSIGISIKDASGQFRDFDDVIMELAAKWNTLDNNTQRYIATVMAGNRQQSRFIALVSNYDELNRAMQTASDSENASIVQVGKTMDSLETKAQQLKNAFSQLYLDLHIESGLKDIYGWLTRIVQTIGKLGIAKGVLPTLANLIGFGTGAKNLINLGKEKIDSIKSQWIVKTDEAEKELKRIREEAERPMTTTMNIDVSQMQHALEMKALDAQNTVISSLNGISGAVPQAQAEKILWDAQKNGTLHTDRAAVIEKLGIKKEDTANYETIDRFLQELDKATTMVQKLAGAVDEGANAEDAKTDAVRRGEQAEGQKEQQVRSSEAAVEEETGSHRTLSERIMDSIRSLFSHKQAVDNDTSSLNNHTGENSGGGSGGISGFLNNHKSGILKGLSIFSSLSRMVGTGLALKGASIQDKSTNSYEGSKVMTGIGNGLSGVGTGISLGMMTGNPIVAGIGGIIGFAVSGLGAIIDGATMTLKEKIELQKQELETLKNDSLKKQAKAIDLSSSIDNIKQLQKVMYQSNDDMQAYKEAMNTLADEYPTLVQAYDTQGNAIIDLNEAEQQLAQVRLEGAQAAREALIKEGDLHEGYKEAINTAMTAVLNQQGKTSTTDSIPTAGYTSFQDGTGFTLTDAEGHEKEYRATYKSSSYSNGMMTSFYDIDYKAALDEASKQIYSKGIEALTTVELSALIDNLIENPSLGGKHYGSGFSGLTGSRSEISSEHWSSYKQEFFTDEGTGFTYDVSAIDKIIKEYSEIFKGKTSVRELLVISEDASIGLDELNEAKEIIDQAMKKNDTTLASIRKSSSYALSQENLYKAALKDADLTADETTNLQGHDIYSRIYGQMMEARTKTDKRNYKDSLEWYSKNEKDYQSEARKVADSFIDWYDSLTKAQRQALETLDFTSFSSADDVLAATGIRLNKETEEYKAIEKQFIENNKSNKDRILKTIYNYDEDQQLWTLNDDLTGLKELSSHEYDIDLSTGIAKPKEEINKAMDIAYRISTSMMISKYSDYFTTQLLEINDLAEQGLTVVAEARLNALDTLSQQILQNNGEVQRDLFNLVTSIDFSDYDSILNAQKELENYAKDHKNVNLKPMIDNLEQAASKILFNMNTLTQTITSKITEAAKSIDGIISTNKSGLSFDKALEEFNSLESQFDKIKTFSDAFTFDTQLGRYVYTVKGLQAAIEQKENELSKNIEQASNVKETYTALINQRSNINLKADAQSKKEFINSANVTTLSSDVNIQEAYSQLLGEFYDTYQENERTIGNWHKYLNKRVKEATDQYDAAKIIEQEYRKNEKNQWFQAIDWSALLLNVDFDGTNKVLMDELAKSLNMTGATAEAIINRYFETTYSDEAARNAAKEAFYKTNDEGKISKYQAALGELLGYQTERYLSEATKQVSKTLNIDIDNIEDSAENSIHAAAQFLNTLANEIGKGSYTLEQYNQDAQSVLDKTLAQKSQGKTLLDFASGDINSGALSSLAQTLGQKLTDIVNVETGEFKNAIFDAYLDYDAATNTYKITSSFEEFVEALNRQYGNVIDTTSIQYIEALNSWNDSQIESQNKFKDNLLKQVESIGSAKSGDMLNITYLYNLIGDDLNQVLLKYGAEMKEGILTIQPGAQLQAIYSTIIDELEKTGQLSAQEVGKLKDSLISLFTNITSLISSGISGSLSNEGFAQLSEWASTQGIASLDFVETADGLKLAQHSAIELYNALNNIDSLKADKVFQEISKSLQETNEHYKSISTIENRIVELRKLKDTDDPTKRKQYEEELALAEQIKAVRSTSEDDSFNFMSNEIPAAQKNPLNYLSNWSTAWSTITESAKSGYMDYTDFYNIITEMGNIAQKSGTEINLGAGQFVADAESAADLIRQGAAALSIAADGSIKVDLSKIGANFMTSADGMADGIDEGIKEIARSQIKMLDGMIQLMETVVAMQKLGDVDVNADNKLDLGEIFEVTYEDDGKTIEVIKGFTETYQKSIEKLTEWANTKEGAEFKKSAEEMKISWDGDDKTMWDLLNMREEDISGWSDELKGRYAAIVGAFYAAAQSGDYDLNNILASVKQILAGSGFEGDLEIGDIHLVYKYNTVLEKSKDGKYHVGDKEFSGDDAGFKAAVSYQKATELKALQGIKSEQGENGSITFKHNFITNADYDVETGIYNIKFKDGSTATATSKESANLAIATYAEMTNQDIEDTGAQVTDAKPIEFTIHQKGKANLEFNIENGKTIVKTQGSGDGSHLSAAEEAVKKVLNEVDTTIDEQGNIELTTSVDESSAIEAGKSAKQIAEDAANADPAKIHFVYDIMSEETETREEAEARKRAEQQAHDAAINNEAKDPDQVKKEREAAQPKEEAKKAAYEKSLNAAQNERDRILQAGNQIAIEENYKKYQKEQFDKYAQTDTQLQLFLLNQQHKDEFKSAGETISEGIAKGMVQKPTIVQDSAKSLYNYIEQSFRIAADANSPAKNMIPWGESITDGIIVGMLSRSDSLAATAKQLFDLLQAALSGEEYTLDNIFTDKVLSLTPSSATIETNNNQEDSSSNSAISTVVNNLDDTKSAFASTTVEVESFKEAIPTENLEKLNFESTNLKAGFSKVNSETSTVGRNIRDLGDTSSSTKTPIYELGKEADIARGHVSKFGELAGGAEHPVNDLGVAAASALGQVTSLGDSSSTAAGSLEGLSGAAAAAAASLSNIQVNVSVNVSGGSPGGSSSDSNGSTSNQLNAIHSKGTIGLANAKGTLMGELGPELVVSNGRYFVVGQTGPEIVDLASDAIVFNHLQTKSLLEKGTSPGRGKAITNERTATAYATGSIHGGPAKADAQAALNALIQLRAEWNALLSMSVKDFTSKGSTGGGGGDSQFIKDVERWYNWLQKIAQLEKDINYQESLRSRIASDFNADGYKYYKSQKQSLKDLTAEISTQKELLDSQQKYFNKRREEVNAASNPFSQFYTIDEYGQLKYTDQKFKYTDSEGKTHKYEGGYAALAAINETDVYGNKVHSTEEQMAMMKAFLGDDVVEEYRYDESKNERDDAAILEEIWSKMEGDQSEFQGLHDSITDLEKSIEDNITKQNEILKEMEDNQISVENRVYDAIVDMRERTIEEMQNERDAIEKTNTDLIQGLSDALSKERELYNNSQNDKELTTLQRQLAILQRSGGSAAEISNLQSQIDSKQQDIYFDKQQQEIDALQEASDAQLERLDRQIELEEETLEYQKAHGLLWDQVYEVMNKSEQYIEDFITGNNSEYWSKSETSFQQEMRQVVFETQQWKALADDGGLTKLIASIEAEVTKDSDTKTEGKKKPIEETQATEEGTQTQSEQPEGGKKQPETEQKQEPKKENIIYEDCNDKYHYKITVGEDGKETTEKESHTKGTKTIGDAAHRVCILCGHDFGRVAGGPKTTGHEITGGKLQPVSQMPPVIQQITDGLSQGLSTVLSWLGVGQPSNTSGSAVPNASNDSVKKTLKQLKEDMLQQYDLAVSYPDSLRDLQHIVQSTSSIINTNSNSPVIIEHAEVNMKVDKMNDKYDASRAADDVMKEMLTIARKTSAQNRIRG